MRGRTFAVVAVLVMLVAAVLAPVQPASAQTDSFPQEDVTTTVFLPLMGVGQTVQFGELEAANAGDEAGAPSGADVQPVLLKKGDYSPSNPCAAAAIGLDYGLKVEGAAKDGTYSGNGLEIEISNSNGYFFDWEQISAPAGQTVAAVVVKGGTDASWFDYVDTGLTADTLLHAPAKANGTYRQVSNVVFCLGDSTEEPKIKIVKSTYGTSFSGDGPTWWDGNEDPVYDNEIFPRYRPISRCLNFRSNRRFL